MNPQSLSDSAVWTVSWLDAHPGGGKRATDLRVIGTANACAVARKKVDELQKHLGYTDANEYVQLKRGT